MANGFQLIDTHCHLNFQAYTKDVDAVIRRALDQKISLIIPATELKSSKRAVEIARKYEAGVYAAVGLHPVHLQDSEFEEEGKKIKMKGERFDYDSYQRLAQSGKVVAIGEIGLDYHYLPIGQTGLPEDKTKVRQNQQLQQFTFLQQLELANDIGKPAIIHCRDAHDDVLKLIKDFYSRKPSRSGALKGVMHCFSGDWELAWQYFDLGFLISFTGLITFNNSWDDLLRKVPLNKIMIETDSPFMAPATQRGKRNEPSYVVEVAKKIAELKNITVESVAKATTQNAQALFGIK
ncbi:MAG: TatD family hydrolase [bacterium]|nr:TatD family hydrolase [bacterium]